MSKKAAQYVRMSTEHQQYSTAHQQAKILEYAHSRSIDIVRSYADEARSGLRLQGRDALQQLLADVTAGSIPFTCILVYDVSRWGRFQDADESAHYEFICRRAGVQVIYCAEQFENDGSPMSNIVKGLKRVMAGEYSRELSEKTFAGQSRLAKMGFRVGARAGFGLRRVLIDRSGNVKGLLAFGERKSIQTDRVVLVPGPADEVQTVQNIFNWFVGERLLYKDIARRLERLGVAPPPGLLWTKSVIKFMLRNEKYVGHVVYNRTSNRLSRGRIKLPREAWVRCDNAFPPIVDEALFEKASILAAGNPRRISDEDLLAPLLALYQSAGHLTQRLVSTTKGMPSIDTYRNRFGSTTAAFAKVGFKHACDFATIGSKAQVTRRRLRRCLDQASIFLRATGAQVCRISQLKIELNRAIVVTFVSISLRPNRGDERLQLDPEVDVVVAVRFPDGDPEAEYFILPRDHFTSQSMSIPRGAKSLRLEPYRCAMPDLADSLISLSIREWGRQSRQDG